MAKSIRIPDSKLVLPDRSAFVRQSAARPLTVALRAVPPGLARLGRAWPARGSVRFEGTVVPSRPGAAGPGSGLPVDGDAGVGNVSAEVAAVDRRREVSAEL